MHIGSSGRDRWPIETITSYRLDLSAPLPGLTSLLSAVFETYAVTLVEVPAEV